MKRNLEIWTKVWIWHRLLVITTGVIDIDLGSQGSSIECRLDSSGISTIKHITSGSHSGRVSYTTLTCSSENPPPKVVQGYKFNIFYPDLMYVVPL